MKEHLRNGGNEPVPAHFATNGKGEPHTPHCRYEPAPETHRIASMIEALQNNDALLFNINFSTSFVRERGKLKPEFARAAMPKLDGDYRPDWIRTNRGHYARYSIHSLEKMRTNYKALKQAAAQCGLPLNQVLDNVRVSYLHAVIPWSRFTIPYDDDSMLNTSKDTLHAADVFRILYDNMKAKPDTGTFWNAAPALRAGVTIIPPDRRAEKFSLFANVRDEIEVDGRKFPLQDVIQVRNRSIRSQIQCAGNFSIVATPYIERANIEQVLQKSQGFIHLNWPVTNEAQLNLR